MDDGPEKKADGMGSETSAISKDYLRELGVILKDKVLLSLRRMMVVSLSGTVLPMALV